MESQNRKKALELGHTHQPFCSEEDEPKNEGRCSGKPRQRQATDTGKSF